MKGLNYLPVLIEKLKTTQPEKIILFGSYAYGEPAANSDLDILVVTGDDFIPSSFSEKSKIYLKISHSISEIKKSFLLCNSFFKQLQVVQSSSLVD